MKIAEIFYSIQGEGASIGIPSIFIRFSNCNLSCGIAPTHINTITKYKWNQKQVNELKLKNATWVCDTIATFTQGKDYTLDKLDEYFIVNGFYSYLRNGAHLIFTGGEPLLNETNIIGIINLVNSKVNNVYYEIETNGTLLPNLLKEIDIQFNISPKLKNSGLPEHIRIKRDILNELLNCNKSYFKFVVSNEKDILEILELQNELDIPNNKIILMPACQNRDEKDLIQNLIVEYCKTNNFRYSTRLQIDIWNKTVNV